MTYTIQMKSRTFFRTLILFFLFLSACSRNPLGEDLKQPILNLAITLTQNCTNTLAQDSTYSCQINAATTSTDLVWSLNGATTCAWASIDSVTGIISGTPTDDHVGTCQAVVIVQSGKASSFPFLVPITVTNVAPTLSIANAAALTEDDPVTIIRNAASVQASEEGFGTYASDYANTTGTRCADNASSINVDASTGAVSFAPALNYSGTCNIRIQFDDGNGLATSTVASEFSITVNPVNDAPIITPLATQNTNEDSILVLNFTVTDPDNTFSCAAGVSATSTNAVLIPVGNIVFSGTTPNCVATITPAANSSGISTLSFTANDGLLTDTNTFNLNVNMVNDPPSITPIANQNINEDGNVVVNFTLSDPDSVLTCSAVNLSANSSNTTVMPIANIVFGGVMPNCTATLTPPADQNGVSSVTISVNDNGLPNLISAQSFLLTVNSINDAPVLSAIINQTTNEDTAAVVNFTINDVDNVLTCAGSMSATSTNAAVLPVANIVFTGVAPNCTATMTPVANQSGVSNLSLMLTDGVLTSVQSFSFTVNAVNDAPVLSVIANQSTLQDTPLAVSFTINDVDNVLTCAGSVTATSSNTTLLPLANIVFTGVAPNCTATLSPALLQNGVSNLSFTLTDGLLTSVQNFTFTASAVNYPPTLSAIANQVTSEDNSVAVNFTINDVDNVLTCAGSMSASSTNATVIPVANIVFTGVAPNCTATVTPVADQSGVSNLSFTVTDALLTDVKNFSFTVNAVNDAPTISAITNQVVSEDNSVAVNFTINDVDNVLTCAGSLSASSTNAAVIPVANIVFTGVAPNCTATMTPVADQSGVSNLSFTVSDSVLTSVQNFSFTVNAVNDAPTISVISNQVVSEDNSVAVNFTINDIDNVLTCVGALTATSTNAALLPVGNIVFTGVAPNCTATMTPVADQSGVSNISFTVSDSVLTSVQNFSFTVNAANDAPAISVISNQVVSEDNSVAVNFTINDVDNVLTCAGSLTATSTNAAMVPLGNIVFTGVAPNCTATMTPVADQSGVSNLSFTVTDGLLTSVQNFSFTVNAVNDSPLISAIANQNTLQDTPLAVSFTINDVDNVLTCAGSVTATSSNIALLPVANIVFTGIAPNCTATLSPAFLQNGLSNLSFTLTDGTLTAVQNFTLTVAAFNYDPVMSAISNQVVSEDNSIAVNFTVTDVDNVLACSAANLSATSSNTTILPVMNIVLSGVAPNCTATMSPAADQSGLSNITLTVNDNGTPNKFDAKTFSLTVNAVNDAPTISVITNQVTSEDNSVAVNFTINDIDSALTCAASVTATSSNTTVLPVANIIFTGVSPNCTATMTPASNQNGVSNLGFTVSDGSLTALQNFSLTVNAVNDAPTISVIANQVTSEDNSVAVNFTINDIDSALTCAASVAATSSNTTVLPVANIIFTGVAPNCTATLTPAADQSGVSNLSFTVSDGSLTALQNFSLTTNAVNDGPSISVIANQVVSEDNSVAVNFTISDIDNVLTCATSVTATSTNITVLPVANIIFTGVSPNCTATLTPASDQNGVSNLGFTVSDGSLTALQNFSLTVNAVNDSPTISVIANQVTNEDNAVIVNFTINDVDSALTCATSVTATSTNITVLPVANIIFTGVAPNCTATLTPATDQNGVSNLGFTVSDGTLTALQNFSFTANAVNDAPTISVIANQVTSEDNSVAVNFTIADIDSVLLCTSANLSVSSLNTTLIPNANVVWSGVFPNCTATISPAANQNGLSNLTVTLVDNGTPNLQDSKAFSVTVNAVNDSPVQSVIANQVTNEDTASVINFTISDVDNALTCAGSMSANSSDLLLVPLTNIIFTGVAPNCTATVTPGADLSGVLNLTFRVSDGVLFQDQTFQLTINAVNDGPTISVIANQVVSEDNSVAVNFTINDVDTVLTCAGSLSASSSNTTVLPVGNIVFTGVAPNCTATMTPAANQNGISNLGFTVSDGSLTALQNLSLTVNAVNDSPVLSAIANQTTAEDVPLVVNFTINDTDNVLTCAGSMSATSTDAVLLPVGNIVFGGVAPNCTATLTSALNLSGISTLNFTLTDTTVTDVKSFTFTVTPVDDPPTISAIADQTINEDGNVVVNFTIADPETALTCAASVTPTSTNAVLLPIGNIVFGGVAPNCTATITPVANANGTTNIVFSVTDGTTIVTSGFNLIVNPVNDPPTIPAIGARSTTEDNPLTFAFTINDVDDTLNCNGSIIVTSSNATMLPQSTNIAFSGIAPNCSVTLTPVANRFGTSNINFFVTDGVNVASRAFTLTVTSVNDAPIISTISNTTTGLNVAAVINFTITDVDNTLTCTGANLSATSSDIVLLPVANITWSGTAPNCTGTFTPDTAQFGTSNVTVSVNDNSVTAPTSLIASTSFVLTVNSVLRALSNTAYVMVGNTINLSALGGTGNYSWSLVSDPTGGSIDSVTGDYTAGSTPGTATARVNDGSNTYDVTIQVYNPLTMTPLTSSLAINATQNFTASGGYGSLTFSLVSGSGSINSATGVYTAPAFNSSDVIRVTDQAVPPNSISASITVSSSLLLNPQTLNLAVGSTMTFAASAGTPAYTYSVLSGGGSFVGAVYTAPNSLGPVNVRVADSVAAMSDAAITIIKPIDLVTGAAHACAIYSNSQVKCWGSNSNGQLGIGSTNSIGDSVEEIGGANAFTNLDNARTISKISAGLAHTCALFTDGNVKCWGSNSNGQLGYGDNTQRGHTTATTPNNLGVINLGVGKTAKDIVAGNNITCAILNDDSVKCWGQATNGMLGNGNTTVDLLSPAASSIVLPGGQTAKALSTTSSGQHICARLSNDTISCWGLNSNGQCGDGTSTSPRSSPVLATQFTIVSDFAAGRRHTCVILNDGSSTIQCLGAGTNGSLGQGNTSQSLVAVTVNTNITAASIKAGNSVTCVTNSAGTSSKCWGSAQQGFLMTQNTTANVGDNAGEMAASLASMPLGEALQSFSVTKLSIGSSSNSSNFGCLLTSTDKIKCWGGALGGVLLNASTTANYGDSAGESGNAGFLFLNH